MYAGSLLKTYRYRIVSALTDRSRALSKGNGLVVPPLAKL